MIKNVSKKKKMYLILPFFLLVGESFFKTDVDGPESLRNTGFYTYEEQLFYHKDFNINDLLTRYNKYSLTRLSEFISTATIYRKGDVSPLPQQLDPNIGKIVMRTPRYGILTLDDWITQSSNQGFLVIHKGKILYERYDKMADYQHHGWMSVTKTLVGLATHMLSEQGLIDFDKPVETYLPKYKGSAYGQAKVRNVMNMSSGILSSDQIFGYFMPYFRFKNTAFNPNLYSMFRSLPRVETPGVKFVYSSVDTLILTMIVEAVTNTPFSHFLTENLWFNIGAEHDAAIGLLGTMMGNGYPIAGGLGLMMSTLRDLGRYGMIYTPSWAQVSKVELYSKKHREEMQDPTDKPNLDEYFSESISEEDFPPGDVGFGEGDVPIYAASQWDMVFQDGDMLKLGLNGQGLYVSYGKDLVVAYFGYDENPPEYAQSYARAIARYIVDKNIQQYKAPE